MQGPSEHEIAGYTLCERKPAYRLAMTTRGFSIDVPAWWLDDLMKAIERDQLTHTDLAAFPVPAEKMDAETRRKAIGAARVKVTRFFHENPDERVRTIEVIRAWTDALKLTPFEFRAATREQAKAMADASKDPAKLASIMAAVLPPRREVAGRRRDGCRRLITRRPDSAERRRPAHDLLTRLRFV